MKRLGTVFLMSFVLYGCSEEALPLVDDAVVETDSSPMEDIDDKEVEVSKPIEVATSDEVRELADKEYLLLLVDELTLFGELMGEVEIQMNEVKVDVNIIDDEEWLNKLEDRFARINNIYDKVEGIEYVPEAYKDFHEKMETAVRFGADSSNNILNGIAELDEEMFSDGLSRLKISSMNMRMANEILINK